MADEIQAESGQPSYTAVDGFSTLTGGVHTGLAPSLLASSQYARGINITTRGGLATTRPAFQKVVKLGSGSFQGCGVYSLDEGDHLAYCIDGTVYVMRSDGVIFPTSGAMDPAAVVYFTQVHKWMVAQDGTSRPAVIRESSTGAFERYPRDVVLDPDVSAPKICLMPGTIGVYAHGRYHYVPSQVPGLRSPPLVLSPDGMSYLNPDEIPTPDPSIPDEDSGRGSCFISSDVADALDPRLVFRMTETRVLDTGGAYGLPMESGLIYGMGTMRGAATGTGVGSLFVFGSSKVSAFEVSIPRTSNEAQDWKSVGFSQVAFNGAGTRSPFSIVNINDDLWYVGSEKHVRSVSYDASQLSQAGYAAPALFNVPKSFEAQRWVDQTSDGYRPHISATLADNRFLWTLCDGRAIGSIDFAQTYTATPTELPILHEGIWTGFEFLRVVSLSGVLHAVVKSGNDVWLLKSTGDKDLGVRPIRSELVTRAFGMWYNEQQQYTWLKKLRDVDMQVSGITQPTTLSVYFRPTSYPEWTLLGTKEFNVPEGSPPQTRARVRFAPNYATAFECDPITKLPLYNANLFQFKLVWTGRLTIDRFVVTATRLREIPFPLCDTDNPDGLAYPVDSDTDFDYAVSLGDFA